MPGDVDARVNPSLPSLVSLLSGIRDRLCLPSRRFLALEDRRRPLGNLHKARDRRLLQLGEGVEDLVVVDDVVEQLLQNPLRDLGAQLRLLAGVPGGGARASSAVSSGARGCASRTLIVAASKRGAAAVAGRTRGGGGETQVGGDTVRGGETRLGEPEEVVVFMQGTMLLWGSDVSLKGEEEILLGALVVVLLIHVRPDPRLPAH
mmetsp:Transcript_30038/g.96437  ORF Transcript_30038/g.96437 Transcript_30038/m.96437 type:complete len:205 (-) Transcript_30038:3506-4120(-)